MRISASYTCSEEEADARKTVKEIEKAKAHSMALNLRENENCKKAVDKHMKVFGKLSVLVNNSMTSPISTFDVVEKTCRTNVLSIFVMCGYALPHMKRGASIVNSSSVARYVGNPQLVDYSATKGAVARFTRLL